MFGKVFGKNILVSGFLLLGAALAPAQVAEFGVHGGASRLQGEHLGSLALSPGSVVRVSLKDGWRFGFRMTFNNWRFFGHELGYAYNRTQLRFESTPPEQAGMAIHQGFYNFLVYALPEGSPVRPFAAGGGHFSNFTPPGASASQGGGSNKFGLNYGGGVKIRVSPRFVVRLDVREYLTGKPFDLPGVSGSLRQLEISAGFSFVM